jgi:signal transduction histidine kinase
LVSISGNAEMLHNQLNDHPTHARRLAVVLQAAGRGAALVRQLMAFSRKQTLEPVIMDLNQVVRGIGDLLRATLGRRIRVETKLDAELWPALIDPAQIEHVILNLAINARDAMPDGGTLTIATRNTTLSPQGRSADLQPGEYVVVAVSDTGSGMTEDVLHNAFEPFFAGRDGDWISDERWVLMKPFLMRTLTDTLRAALGLAQDTAATRHQTFRAT